MPDAAGSREALAPDMLVSLTAPKKCAQHFKVCDTACIRQFCRVRQQTHALACGRHVCFKRCRPCNDGFLCNKGL